MRDSLIKVEKDVSPIPVNDLARRSTIKIESPALLTAGGDKGTDAVRADSYSESNSSITSDGGDDVPQETEEIDEVQVGERIERRVTIYGDVEASKSRISTVNDAGRQMSSASLLASQLRAGAGSATSNSMPFQVAKNSSLVNSPKKTDVVKAKGRVSDAAVLTKKLEFVSKVPRLGTKKAKK